MLDCTDDVTYHVTSPVQCKGLFKIKSLYGIGFRIRSSSLHFTAPTLLHCISLHRTPTTPLQWSSIPSTQALYCIVLNTLRDHYTPLHCTHYTAPPLLHCTSRHCFPTTPLNFIALHPTHCTPTVPLHFAALNFCIQLYLYCILPHCLHYTAPHYYTTFHPLHCAPLLHWTVLTTLHHYSTVLNNILYQHCMPLPYTAWFSAIQCNVFHCTSPAVHFTARYTLHCIALHGAVRHNELYFTTLHQHCTSMHGAVQWSTLHCILHPFSSAALYWILLHGIVTTLHFTSTSLNFTSLHGAVHFTILHLLIMYFTALHILSIPRKVHIWTSLRELPAFCVCTYLRVGFCAT